MGKGISPMRLFMRGNSKKSPDGSSKKSSDGSSSSVTEPSVTSSTTPQRHPLCPIPESMRNPLTPSLVEQPDGAATPKSKTEQPTPRAKAKLTFGTQEKYPHLENSEGSVNTGLMNGTPDKNASVSSGTSTAPLNSKTKYSWQTHHSSSMSSGGVSGSRTSPAQGRFRAQQENIPTDGLSDISTPPRSSKQSTADGNHVSTGFSNSAIQQNAAGSARAHSTQTTPRSLRNVRSGYDSESGLQQNGTPSKSVARTLKYGQQQQHPGTSSTTIPGLANVRSTGSQHVITRTMGILQSVKGPGCQTSNHTIIEQQFDLEEDSNFWTDHNVQVLIRTRPLNSSEIAAQGTTRCLRQESPHTLTWLGQPESRYTFDHVAGENITQEKLFRVAGLPMVENCMSGYNSCMFAYGQTGSGKTHTMLGDIEDLDHRPSDKRGMTPRVFEYLFSKIRMEQERRQAEQLKYFCKCSFLEIYNEQITDLLEPTSTNLQLREDAKKGVYVENLTEVEVTGVQDVIQLLLQGSANRKVASTNMNRESSRSHSVFTCIVESKWESNSMMNSRYGRLHLVDLAGSERQKTSGAEGGRLKEAANINKSLSTLGLVIMILVDVANGKQRHVPYRDSKLTFLLQDSLGGNSKTIMIANVSPSSCNAMETLSTLKFAQRAKFIRNNAVINEDASGDVIVLRQQIQELKVEVDRLRRESISRTPSMRFGSSLQNGSMDGDNSVENVDSGAVDSNHSPDSSQVKTKAYIIEKKLKGMEAVLAGALRREQVAEDTTKKLAAEVEQLNRLVHQREEDSQCAKMMLRFREDKIRRLEGVADGVLSAELYYKEEQRALMEELQLIRARLDRNPELTRFAMENIRLMEQLRRYQEFYDCGEKDVLLEEIAGIRNQFLDVLDAKLGEEAGQLTTPQKRALAPEIAARARENELLLIEVQGYQKEVKECRTNLNNCLVANAELTRQVDQMQAMITQLKSECSSKQQELEALKNEERWVVESQAGRRVHEELQAALQEAENLRAELENSRKWSENVASSQAIAERLECTEASLAAAQETASTAQATVKQIRLETEELAVQQRESLTSLQEAAMIWRVQESELRTQLKSAQEVIDQLTARTQRDVHNEDDEVGKDPAQGRLLTLQEIETKYCEEITDLQLELESVEDVLKEERQQRLEAEQKIQHLTKQLDEATSKLEHEKSLVKAFEGQNLFSIRELEKREAQLRMVSDQLRESQRKAAALEDELEELEEISSRSERRRDYCDAARHSLQLKLEKARREREEVKALNELFQIEKASRVAQEKEIEMTRTQAETETALALTTMQEEILALREEMAISSESEVLAKLQLLQLKHELEEFAHRSEELQMKYNTLASEKDVELRNLQRDWESATAKLIDYLAEGDEQLIEAAREMDDMVESSFSPRLVGAWKDLDVVEHENLAGCKKRKAFEVLHQHLQEARSLARETEESVRALGDGVSPLHIKADEAILRELEKKSMAAFVLVTHLVDRVKGLNAANSDLIEEKQELCCAVAEKDTIITALQQKIEDDLSQQDVLTEQYQNLVEKHDRLNQELEHVVRATDLWKSKAEDSEVKLACSSVVIQELEGVMKDAEMQVSGLEKRALSCLDRVSRDDQLALEREQVLMSLLVELDGTLTSVSEIETGTVCLQSMTDALQGGITKVRGIEETVTLYRSTVTALQSKLSEATTTLQLKVEELERAQEMYEASQLALKEERALLTQEKKQSRNESVGKEKAVTSFLAEIQTLEANLNQAQLKISEMTRGVEALTIANEELAMERDRLLIASQETAKSCSEKEQALVQIQADLHHLQSRVNEAEIREQSISLQIEELIVEKQEWEFEKRILEQDVEVIRAEKQKLELVVIQLKSKLEEKQMTIFKSLGRSQLTLEEAEIKLLGFDEELRHLERTRTSLEQEVTDLELTASSTVQVLEEKERKLSDLQLKLEAVQSQMMDSEISFESLKAEIISERNRWMNERKHLEQVNQTLKQEYIASIAQLREQLSAAEMKLSSSEMELSSVAKKVQILSSQKTEVELELAKVNEDAVSANSNLKLREEELEKIRASGDLLKSRCDEAEEKIVSMQKLLQQYVLSEESWKAEKVQLVEKLKEVESMSASMDQSMRDDAVEFRDLSSDEVPHAHIQRLKHQIEGLKRKISEKDDTILSARTEMEVAIANLKEAELEMDKLQAEKDILLKTCEESVNTMTSMSTSLRTAEGAVLKKQLQIEAFEKEMQKVGDIVDEWELKMHEAEKVWKTEKEELMKETDLAKLEAREKGLEAAVLNQKFQETQLTLLEAETLVNLLVRANESAKHNALDWKQERDELRQSQEVWVPERDRLLAAINCLKMEMNDRDQQTSSICRGTAADLLELLSMVGSAQEEIALIRSEHAEQLEMLTAEVKNVRSDLLQVFSLPKELRTDIDAMLAMLLEQRKHLLETAANVGHLKQELEGGRNEVEILELKLSQLQSELMAFSVSAAASGARVSELEAEVKALQSQLQNLDRKLELRQSEMDEYLQNWNASIYELTIERDALQTYSDAQTKALWNLEQKVILQNSQVEGLKEQISSLNLEMVSTRNSMKESDRLVSEKDETVSTLHRQLQASNTDNCTLSEIVSGLQMEIIQAEANVSDIGAELEDCKLQLNDLLQTETEKVELIEALTAERNQVHAELLRQNNVVHSLGEELVSLRAEIAEHEQKKAEHDLQVQMTLDALDTETAGDSIEMTHLHIRVSQLKQDLSTERTTVRALKEKLGIVQSENSELIEQLEAQLMAQSTALIGLEEEMLVMNEDRARDQDNFDVQISELKEILDQERSRVTCLEEKLKMTETEKDQLNCSLDEKVQQLCAERDHFQVTAAKVKVQLEEGMRTCKDLEEKLAAMETENTAVLQTLEANCQRVTEERDQLELKLAEQAASLACLRVELEGLKEERSAKEEDIEKQHSDLQSYKNELEVAREAAERDVQVLSLNRAELEDLKQKCKSLVGENDELKCEIIAFEGRVLDLEEETQRKKKAVSELESKLKREKEKSLEHETTQSIQHRGTEKAMAELELKDLELRTKLEQVLQENESLKCRVTELEDTVLDLTEETERRKIAQEEMEETLSREEDNSLKQQSVLSKKVQDVQVELDMLQRELVQQLDIQKRLKEELKNAEAAREMVSNESGLLRKCVIAIEQSHALCVNEAFTQALSGVEGFRAAQMELETFGEVVGDMQLRSEDILSRKSEISQEELCHATSVIHELRNEMKVLSGVTETALGNKLGLIDNLQKELLLRDKHLIELEADLVTTLEELKNDRSWISKQFLKILKKLKGVSGTQTVGHQESARRVADRNYAQTVLQQQMDLIDEALDIVLVENTKMKSEVVTLQNKVDNLAVELDRKSHDMNHLMSLEEEFRQKDQEMKSLLDKQDRRSSHNVYLLNVYKRETEALQEILLSNLEVFEDACSQAPDLSLVGPELRLVQGCVKKMGLQRMLHDLKEEIYTFQHTTAELQLRCSALEEELDDKRNHIDLLSDDFMLERENSLRTIQKLKDDLTVAESDRDKFQTEVLVLTEQLEMAQSLADERETVAAEARQIAELSKSQAEKKAEEAKILEKSVEELESTVYALESQLGIVKRETERQRRAKEDVELELGSMRQQMQLMKITIDRQDAQTARDFEDAKSAKTELDRMVIEMKNQQMQTRQTVESLQQECAEKDVQLRSCKAHIAELMSNAEKQASENQQKLKVLELMVEQLKTDERKTTSTAFVVSKPADPKNTVNKAKGSGSPFKCIGSGLAQQRSSEIDEELSAARKRIRELETTAAARQKEVFMLNTKLAEAESMTHDVVRDLLGVKMDIASYATLLSQQKVQQIADKARRRTEEAHQKDVELEKLRDRLDELITERESWLEEINRRQAESVAARVSAEKLRLKDSLLTSDNEKLKAEVSSLRKKVSDLEEEYRKLSGQQNLQQRIHHHAKIKEENNSLKSQNEDLSGKLRRTEILFTRVNDELARYRTAEGRTPFLNFDEEERLRKKLQETEENRMQLAQNFVSLCTAITTAAGVPRTSRDPDAATAMSALLQLQDRLEAMERELLDLKLKARISNEKRRMSDLREQHTPRKNLPTNFTANQQITSPDTSSR